MRGTPYHADRVLAAVPDGTARHVCALTRTGATEEARGSSERTAKNRSWTL